MIVSRASGCLLQLPCQVLQPAAACSPGSSPATSVAKASSQALDDAAYASTQAVATAVSRTCCGGDASLEAQALSRAV